MFYSPGAYFREQDNSLYATTSSPCRAGLVGCFSWGPMNTRTTVTTVGKLESTFGFPVTGVAGFYVGREFLREGNQLDIVRVGHGASLAYATCAAKDVGLVDTLTFNGLHYGSFINTRGKILITAGTSSGVKVTFTFNGQALEVFDNVTKANAEATINDTTTGSDWFTVTNITAGAPGEPTVGQTLTFSGGTNGTSGIVAADINGTAGARSGINAFYDRDEVDIDIIGAPGFGFAQTAADLITLVEYRKDCVAFIDAPDDPTIETPQDIIDWHNGQAPMWTHSAFNTSYGGLYWSWYQTYDEYNATDVWVPPTGQVFAAVARTFRDNKPWYAAAGTRRGLCRTAKALRYSPEQGERDLLHGSSTTNRVNPLVKKSAKGIVIHGQHTLYRTNSALDRLNVRFLLNTLKKNIASFSEDMEFEQNDEILAREFRNLIDPILAAAVTGRGVREYRIVIDDTTTTDQDRDENRLVGKIYIKPIKTAEQIVLDFIITSQGANIEELIQESAA